MKSLRRNNTIRRKIYEGDERLFGKYNQLLIIIITFTFTTVCGSFLAYFFQNRSWEKQYEDNLIKSEREVAEKIFSEVSSIMDERMYIMRRVFWSYKFDLNKSEKNKRWAEYDAILMKWNGNLNKNYALLEIYFGINFRETFEEIHWKFRDTGESLIKFKDRKISKQQFYEISSKLDNINIIYSRFNIQMLSAIRDSKIGKLIYNKQTETDQ